MSLRALWLFLPFVTGSAAALAACTTTKTEEVPVGDDDDDDTTGDAGQPPDNSGLGVLQFRPNKLYSGVDGTHAFQVPFAVYDFDESDVEVTAEPSSAVVLKEKTLAKPVGPNGTDKGKYYWAETKQAGTVTLTVKSKGKTATATLLITQYEADRYAAGETRYKTGSPPCTDCHVNGQAIDHSPTALVSVTDEKVGLIMSTGLSSAGVNIPIDRTTYPNGHKWTTGGSPEQFGLITYLRAIEPNGFK